MLSMFAFNNSKRVEQKPTVPTIALFCIGSLILVDKLSSMLIVQKNALIGNDKKTFELCRSLKSGILAMRKEWNNIM